MNQFNQQDAIWDYFQNEVPEAFMGSLPRLRYLLKSIPRGAKVLNIGVGIGLLEKLALDAGLDIYAMDPVPKSIESLQTRLGLGAKAKVGYGENIPFPDSTFDVVIATEVLEHLSDGSIAAMIPEIRRILKPGGIFKGTVPARENLAEQMVVCPDCSKRFHRWGHHQSFTVERMQQILQSYLEVRRAEEKLFISFGTLNFKGKAVGAIKLLLFHFGQYGSDQNVYFEAVKA